MVVLIQRSLPALRAPGRVVGTGRTATPGGERRRYGAEQGDGAQKMPGVFHGISTCGLKKKVIAQCLPAVIDRHAEHPGDRDSMPVSDQMQVMATLGAAGLVQVRQHLEVGVFSEYQAIKPG
jgi:hypothetical protein